MIDWMGEKRERELVGSEDNDSLFLSLVLCEEGGKCFLENL